MEYADFIRERRLIQKEETRFTELAIAYAREHTTDQIDGAILGEQTITVYGRKDNRPWASEIPVPAFVRWMNEGSTT